MSAPRSRPRARLAALVSVVLAITGFQLLLAVPAAQANPAGTALVISEVYGAGGNANATYTHDFVELYNPTDAPIPLTGMSLQYRSGTSTVASTNVASLDTAGSVPAHDWFVVTLGSNGTVGVPVPNVDFAGAAVNMGGNNGQIFLATSLIGIDADGAGNTTVTDPAVVDFVGYGTATIKEGATGAPAPGPSSSVTRNAAGADSDVNGADFTEATPMSPGEAPGIPPLSLTNPGGQSTAVGTPVTLDVSADGGTPPYTYGATGLPSGLSINASTGEITGAPDTVGTYNVEVTVTDSAAPTAGTGSASFSWVVDVAGAVTAIASIQGTTGTSPLAGTIRTTQGVVTARYPTGGFDGFYLQTPGADDTPGASDAIFVYGPTFDEATLAIGDPVEVTGTVSELTTAGPNTLTEITATSVTDIASLGTAVANPTIPDSDCALNSCPVLADGDLTKEEFEGELFQPTDPYTVTDTYDGSATNPTGSNSSSFFGEIGLAADSDIPLVSPTEVIDASAGAAITAKQRYNNMHRVVLDDGSSRTFWNTANTAAAQNDLLPWFTQTHQVRVGAAVTFPQPVILENRFGWKVQPTTTVVGAPTAAQPQFEQDRPATPADVGGDLKLATFNVLNYFTTLGETVAGCEPFVDRADNPIAVDSCPGDGPRGAWNAASFQRQQAKIVNAINALDADIVSLEEIENSLKVDGPMANRDEALGNLVAALNAAAGSTRWAFVPSPAEADRPPVAEEDVIRTAFIYDPDTVDLVGTSKILTGSAAFANAREPLAQAFKAEDGEDTDGFAVVVNHFKSKGCGDTPPTGDNATGLQGCFNGDRVRQAEALHTFANTFADAAGVDAVFLTGDFNAYTEEDPVQVLTDHLTAPWTNLESTDDPDEETYSFDGSSGSLDHVFASAVAETWVTGVDIWEINANETVFNQYSRFNYVGTNLYSTGPFAASDHNPEIVGIDVPGLVNTSVAAPNVTVGYGQAAQVAVTVTGGATTASGEAELFDGATSLGTTGLDTAGRATFTVAARTFPPGTRTLTVVYDGDTTHNGSQTTLTLTTAKAASTVAAGDASVQYGAPVTVTVNVGAPVGIVATGTVTIQNGATTLGTGTVSGGVATVTLPARSLPAGNSALTAAYSGDATLGAGTDSFTVSVSKATSTTEAKVKPKKPKKNNKVKLAVQVEGSNGVEATGQVKIKVGGKTITKTLKNGKVTVTLGKFGKGKHKVKVTYLGSTDVAGSDDTVRFTVS